MKFKDESLVKSIKSLLVRHIRVDYDHPTGWATFHTEPREFLKLLAVKPEIHLYSIFVSGNDVILQLFLPYAATIVETRIPVEFEEGEDKFKAVREYFKEKERQVDEI